MVFIRGPEQTTSLARHFRGDVDGFVFGDRGTLCEAVVMANADRIVELFLALAEHLPPAVTVELDDARSDTRWRGDGLALADARDAIARIKSGLATHAGVEVTLVGIDDQLTLTANLELFAYARTDRWLYLLQGKGLRRRRALRQRSWRLARHEFAASPAMAAGVRDLVERLGLQQAEAQ